MSGSSRLESKKEITWDGEYIQEISNHPVHIMNTLNELSPSAFIPFCQFGEDTNLLGIKNTKFKFPICNSFKPKILENQLCYQIDLKLQMFDNKSSFPLWEKSLLQSKFLQSLDISVHMGGWCW